VHFPYHVLCCWWCGVNLRRPSYAEVLISSLADSQGLALRLRVSLLVAFCSHLSHLTLPEALFAKQLCDLLVSLKAAIPGNGKEIACLLTGKDSRGNIKKVKKSLRSKSKKAPQGRRRSCLMVSALSCLRSVQWGFLCDMVIHVSTVCS
jgi:hypothetical protein